MRGGRFLDQLNYCQLIKRDYAPWGELVHSVLISRVRTAGRDAHGKTIASRTLKSTAFFSKYIKFHSDYDNYIK
jgi:hypothetical protein